MDTPFVSIILPTYNGSATIKDTVESLLAQTFTNFELLICLDGCTDNTAAILEHLKKADKRIRLLVNPQNRGLGHTLNKLVAFSREDSKYIAMAEHDDWYFPERLEDQVDFLESHPDFGLVSGVAEFTGEGRINRRYPGMLAAGLKYPEDRHEMFKLNYREHIKVINSCMMFRKSVHRDNGLYFTGHLPNLSVDWMYILRFSLVTKIGGLSKTLVKINRDSGNKSLTKNKAAQFKTTRHLIRNVFWEFSPKGIIGKSDRNYALITQYLLEANYYGGFHYISRLILMSLCNPFDGRTAQLLRKFLKLCFKKLIPWK